MPKTREKNNLPLMIYKYYIIKMGRGRKDLIEQSQRKLKITGKNQQRGEPQSGGVLIDRTTIKIKIQFSYQRISKDSKHDETNGFSRGFQYSSLKINVNMQINCLAIT